jgi:2-polyprenyl-3-methyl-5-hydroxy-6-metoxy-1,4-benzoquinol methylase
MPAAEAALAACPMCDAPAPHWKDVFDVNQGLAKDPFAVHRCGACGTLFVHPVPPDLGRYYPPGYHDVPADLAAFRSRLGGQDFKTEIVRRHASGGDLLEIGPSHCEALWLAREAGFRVHGLEMDEACCRFAKDVLGLDDVRRSADPVADLPVQPSYDVITMWHVFEHLPDPSGAAKAIAGALRPGGVLVVAVPNPESLQLAVFGRAWVHLDVPRHTVLAPAAALTARMEALGLRAAGVTFTDAGSVGWNRFGWVRGLAGGTQNRWLRFALRVLGRVCEVVALPLERTGRRGAAFTAVFRKGAA